MSASSQPTRDDHAARVDTSVRAHDKALFASLPGEIALLLRSPASVARRCRNEERLPSLAAAALAATVAGAAAFGGVLGSFRGGAQIVAGAAKVPIALVVTLAIAVPAFYALASALGRMWSMRTVVALALSAAGRSSLVLLAAAPALWLAVSSGLSYHASAVIASLAYALGGLAALGILLRGLDGGASKLPTALAFIAVFFAIGGQTAWILRPYLGRPTLADVPFIRANEGSFADAVVLSMRSAAGVYDAVPAAWSEDENGQRYRYTESPSIETRGDSSTRGRGTR